MSDLTKISEGILKTVIWYDMFDYPLTLTELWRFGLFDSEVSLQDVEMALCGMNNKIAEKNGFYFLLGREATVVTRQERYCYTNEKVRRALRIIKIFRFIPWIKFVGLANMYGAHNLKATGDIDLFIITAKNRIWLTRLFSVLIIKLLNLRPQPEDTQNKICLSFFISENNLDLSRVRMGKDLYFSYLAFMMPLYNCDDNWNRLHVANQWLSAEMPNFKPDSLHSYRMVKPVYSNTLFGLFDIAFGWFESLAKKFELQVLAAPIRNLMNIDTRVMIADDILKLHTNDRREEVNKQYQNKLNEYLR